MHLEPTDEAAMELLSRGIEGEVHMLNLLRFRDIADYSNFDELKPDQEITGREAYQRYIDHTLPFLEASGGGIELLAEAGSYFVGPSEEKWDVAMVVRQNTLDDFFNFASNEEYLKGVGHRTAALIDSRILPLRPIQEGDITRG